MAANTSTTNPYIILQEELYANLYPTPTKGFEQRLFGLLGLAAYVFVITSIFFVLYAIALRRQGKAFWFWKLVAKSEGSYITACIYTASIVPALIATPLIAALLMNNRSVYILNGSQKNTFLWRNLIWIVVWIQGWISSYANVQAVLITSTSSWSRAMPRIANSVYILFPLAFIAGLVIPGVLCSHSWNLTISAANTASDLLAKAAEEYEQTGELLNQYTASIELIKDEMFSNLYTFYDRYLGLLVTWCVGSFILLGVNMVGVLLVYRLKKQIAYSNQPTTHETERSLPALPMHYSASTSHPSTPDTLVGSPGVEDKLDFCWNATEKVTFDELPTAAKPSYFVPKIVSPPLGHRSSLGDIVSTPQSENIRAMKKLVRDLIITITGVSILALSFAADTILLAADRNHAYSSWTSAEVGITMNIWAYLLVLALAMTGITVNEAVFLFVAPRYDLSPASANARFEREVARRQDVADAVQVETKREITVEYTQATKPVAAKFANRQLHRQSRVPVPILHPGQASMPSSPSSFDSNATSSAETAYQYHAY